MTHGASPSAESKPGLAAAARRRADRAGLGAAWRSMLRGRAQAVVSSYRVQLLWWFVLLLAVATIGSVLLVRQVLLQRVDTRVDAELRQEVEEIRTLAGGVDPETAEPFGNDVERIFEVFVDRNVPNRAEVFVTFVGGEYHRSRGELAPGIDADAFAARWASVDEVERGRTATQAGEVDYLAVPFRVGPESAGVFVVAILTDELRADSEAATLAAASVGLVMLIIGTVLASRLADRILRPVALVTRTARSISETDLTQRIPVAGHDEISELATTFNAMLERLDAAFATQRRFIDDAGHELRTPITIIRGHLEVMGDDPADRARAVAIVTDELDRVSRMIDDLLTLARADRPDFVRPGPTDVARLTHAVGEKVLALDDRPWTVEAAANVVALLDEQRITEAMLQLAENACRYSPPGTPVVIGSAADAWFVRFWVRDEGPGIDPGEALLVFDRFHRGSASRRTEGSGLGLSIVRAIAEGHGGTVSARAGDRGGTVMTIVLPRGGGPA